MRLKYACKTDTCSGRDCRELKCLNIALDDLSKAKQKNQEDGTTYKVANLVGLAIISGHKAKQITKQARAPRLQPLKMRIRSHRLTIDDVGQPLDISPK